MSCIPDIKTTEAMYSLYQKGQSLSQVGKAFSVSRQTVYERFKKRDLCLRPKRNPLPFIIWSGTKYTRRPNGYFARTTGNRSYLHVDVWIDAHGSIPRGMEVHHIDEDKENNAPTNLELLTKSDHAKLHGFRNNQFTKARSVK